jgi:hypothetical protein
MASIDIAVAGERMADGKSVAEHCRSANGNYVVALVRGVTKIELIEQMSIALDGVAADDILSITYHADWIWLFPFWKRNSAVILIRHAPNTESSLAS